MRSFLVTVLATLIAINIVAQENVFNNTIKGRLLDFETKEPLIGANVQVLNTAKGAATDGNGYFIINNMDVGAYTLRFSYIGYEPQTRTDIIVRPNRITFVDVQLKTSVIETETIMVSVGYFAKAQEQPTSISNFSKEEIRRAPGSAGDVSRIIYGLPGVAKVNDTKNSLIVRGGSSMENSFYVDNMEINNINHFPEQGSSGGPIGMINVDLISDVNFYTGGFASNYGDRLSSVMEIGLREGNRDAYDQQLDLSFGGFGGAAEGPLANGKGSWLVSAHRSFLDLIVGAIGEDATSVPQYADLQAKLVYDISPSHQITFLDVTGVDAIKHPREMAIKNNDSNYNNVQLIQNTLGFNWRYLWGKKGYSNTSLSHALFKYDFKIYDTWNYIDTGVEDKFVDHQSTEQVIRLRNVNHFRMNNSHKLDFGFETKTAFADYNNYYGSYNDQMGNETPSITVKRIETATKLHAFLSYSWNPINSLTLRPGVRVGHYTYNENTNISPRFLISYQFNPKTSISFSTGIYYQNLPLVLLAQQEENKKLKDPRAHHYVLGLSRLVSESTRLTLELYNKEYYNFPMEPIQPELFIVDEMNYTGMFLPHCGLVDNGRARSHGIELVIQKKLAEDFYGMASASYFRSEYRGLDNRWYDRIYDNRYTFNVEGGYKPNNKWEFSLRWIYAGGAPYTPFDLEASTEAHQGIYDENRIGEEPLPDYHSLNLRFDRRFFFNRSNIVFYLSIWNAYGRKNVSTYQWNQIENKQEESKQWGMLPIFGVEFEF